MTSTGASTIRVLYSFPHPLGRPGIATTAWHQVAGVRRAGVQVRVSCTSLALPLEEVVVRQTLAVLGRRIPHRVLGHARALAWHDWRTARWLEELKGEIDVVHCWPRAGLQTIRMARRMGTPVVRESPNCHTGYAYETVARENARLGLKPPAGHSHTFAAERLAIEEAEFEEASAILVPSSFVEQTFLERGFDPSKLKRHQYGFDPARFLARERPARADDAPLSVAFVGSGEPRKGLHHALEAWHAAGTADAGGRFRICGQIEPAYRARLAKLLAHPSVEELGFVDDPGGILREVDALILPSLEEGSALVTYEARASGCLLLVSDAAGARCEHGRNALVHAAGDVAALTFHLRSLDRDRAAIGRLQRAACEGIEDLSWEAAGRRLAAVYAECIEEARS